MLCAAGPLWITASSPWAARLINHDLPRTAKDFPNVSAPSAKRGDSVKFARSYATPTKKLNLRFFGYFLLIMGFIGVWGERGRGEAIEDS